MNQRIPNNDCIIKSSISKKIDFSNKNYNSILKDQYTHRNKPILVISNNSKEKNREDRLNNLQLCKSPIILRNKANLHYSIKSREKKREEYINNLKMCVSPIAKNSSQISLNYNISEKTRDSNPTEGILLSPRIFKQTILKVAFTERKPSRQDIKKYVPIKKNNVFENYSKSLSKNKLKKSLSYINSLNNSVNTSNSNKRQLDTTRNPNK